MDLDQDYLNIETNMAACRQVRNDMFQSHFTVGINS